MPQLSAVGGGRQTQPTVQHLCAAYTLGVRRPRTDSQQDPPKTQAIWSSIQATRPRRPTPKTQPHRTNHSAADPRRSETPWSSATYAPTKTTYRTITMVRPKTTCRTKAMSQTRPISMTPDATDNSTTETTVQHPERRRRCQPQIHKVDCHRERALILVRCTVPVPQKPAVEYPLVRPKRHCGPRWHQPPAPKTARQGAVLVAEPIEP